MFQCFGELAVKAGQLFFIPLRLNLLLYLLDSFRKETHAGRMKSNLILREPFHRVVPEISEPCIFFIIESDTNAQLVLINLPGEAILFETLRKRGPLRRHAVVEIFISRSSR